VIDLRDYQREAINQIESHWQDNNAKSVLLISPTGSGKTVCFAQVATRFADRELRVGVFAHRRELVQQAREKIGGNPLIWVNTAQSSFLPRKLDLIIVDECHRIQTRTYQDILDQHPKSKILGVTATPVRLDGKSIVGLFDEVVSTIDTSGLISAGWLSPYRLYANPDKINLEGVGDQGGDYSIADLERCNSIVKLSGDSVSSYQRLAKGRQGIIFAISVRHSKQIVARYRECGVSAAHLDGTTGLERRRSVLEDFKAGRISVLSNVDLFTEGFDMPSVGFVQSLRPTKSLGRYLQMFGRGLRLGIDPDVVFIDHTNNCFLHGLPDQKRDWFSSSIQLPSLWQSPDGQISRSTSSFGVLVHECRSIELQEVSIKRLLVISEADVKSYLAGETAKSIAQRLGCTPNAVIAALRRQGVAVRKRTPYVLPEWAIKAYKEENRTMKDLAAELKISDVLFGKTLERQGIAKRQLPTVPDELLEKYRQGQMKISEIARELGLSPKSAKKAVKRSGVTIVRRTPIVFDPQDADDYLNGLITGEAMGDKYGCSGRNVSKRLKGKGNGPE
jgi:transposase-like protein